jgi:hypothetical protein
MEANKNTLHNSDTSKNGIYAYIILLSVTLFYIYFFFTKFEKTIRIKSRFMYGSPEFIDNMIYDTRKNVYTVRNNALLFAFKAAELLVSLEDNKEYTIRGYGRRIPFLGLYQNITHAYLV